MLGKTKRRKNDSYFSFIVVQSCGDPGTPVHGEKTGLDYIYGKIVTFKCNAGYKMTGDTSRRCQTDGKWSGVQPKCER